MAPFFINIYVFLIVGSYVNTKEPMKWSLIHNYDDNEHHWLLCLNWDIDIVQTSLYNTACHSYTFIDVKVMVLWSI